MLFGISDTHFMHKMICEYCPGRKQWCDGSVIDHREQLILAWNSVVGPTDTVIHLGDFGFGTVAESKAIRERLNGTIVMAIGNHDRGPEGTPLILRPDDICARRLMFTDTEHRLIVCRHIPYDFTPLELGGAYQCWHGHCHDRPYKKPAENCVLFGVDVHGPAPVRLPGLTLVHYDNDKGNNWKYKERDDL